jgi:hypothetical protein
LVAAFSFLSTAESMRLFIFAVLAGTAVAFPRGSNREARRAAFFALGKNDASSTDPLEYVKRKKTANIKSLPSSQALEKPRIPETKNEDLDLESTVAEAEAKLAESLPLYMLTTFQQVCSTLVPRLSFIMFLLHVILLLPALRFLKVDLGVSIGPFLYIGPVLLTVPFASLLLWDLDVYESPVIIRGLELYVAAEKSRASATLRDDGARLLGIVQAELGQEVYAESSEAGTANPLQRLTYASVMSRTDAQELASRSLGLKRLLAGKAPAPGSSPSQSTSSARLMRRAPGAQASLLDAARLLVSDAATTDMGRRSDREVLSDLQALKKQLDDLSASSKER